MHNFLVPDRLLSWGDGAAAAESDKATIFQANAKFFGQKPAAKNKKNMFLYLLNKKKRNSYRPARQSSRNLSFY